MVVFVLRTQYTSRMAEVIDLPNTNGEKRAPKNSLEMSAVRLDDALTQDDDGPILDSMEALMRELKKPLELTRPQFELLATLDVFSKLTKENGSFAPTDRAEVYEKLGQAFPEIL